MRKNLSPLQQQLFDLIKDQMINGDLLQFTPSWSEANLDARLEELAHDISRMNAAELRQNIKVWKDD